MKSLRAGKNLSLRNLWISEVRIVPCTQPLSVRMCWETEYRNVIVEASVMARRSAFWGSYHPDVLGA